MALAIAVEVAVVVANLSYTRIYILANLLNYSRNKLILPNYE